MFTATAAECSIATTAVAAVFTAVLPQNGLANTTTTTSRSTVAAAAATN